MVSLAAELPNDNAALHLGVSWVCLDVIGPASPVADAVPIDPLPVAEVLPVAEAAVPEARISGIVGLGTTPRDDSRLDLAALDVEQDEDAEDALIVVEELPPLEEAACVEGALEPAADGAAPSTTIVPPALDDPFTTLVATLADVATGAGAADAAAVLPGLLLQGTLVHALPAGAAQALGDANVLRGGAVTPSFVAQTRAWRAILLGTSDDFNACGGAMLDEWAADVLARLLGTPSRATALRRELRARGVAAFGLVAAA